MPLDKDDYGEWCPRHSTCPEYCNNNELRCDYGMDSRGCKQAPVCIQRGTDKDGEQCPGFCPPLCKNNKALQPGGTAGNGCLLQPVCQG